MKQDLPSSILEAIKKKAEGFADKEAGQPTNKYHDSVLWSSAANFYTSGYKDAVEMMLGFVEWVDKNEYECRFWHPPYNKWNKKETPLESYTTIQLLEKYLEDGK